MLYSATSQATRRYGLSCVFSHSNAVRLVETGSSASTILMQWCSWWTQRNQRSYRYRSLLPIFLLQIAC